MKYLNTAVFHYLPQSPPSRRSGLKYVRHVKLFRLRVVSALAAEWIEIYEKNLDNYTDIVSALAAEWIEILVLIGIISLPTMSPPSRRSGLKLQDMAYDPEVDEVSALAAEWIEIY